jgi:hypothetical protein
MTEEQTRLGLTEDLRRQEERLKDYHAAEQTVTTAKAGLDFLSKAQTDANAKLGAATSRHRDFTVALADAHIDGAGTDPADAARQLREDAEMVEFLTAVLKRVTESRVPAARIAVLQAELTQATIKADLSILATRVHTAQVVLASVGAAELEGGITIKGKKTDELGKIEFQMQEDLNAVRVALEREVEIQQKIRDARANSGGLVTYQNPS